MLKKMMMVAVIALGTGAMTSQPDKAAGPEQEPAKQGQASAIPAESTDKQPHGEAYQSGSGKNTPIGDASIQRSHWWSDSNWWLVIIALCTAGVIGWQSWETRAAAQGAQVAADAAFMNAKAFINAERPWISVTVEPSGRKYGHQIVATNKGRTPAAIISRADSLILIETMELPPDVAVYGKPDDRPFLILPDESIVLKDISEYSFVEKDDWKRAQFRNMSAEGYVFGIIIYRDLLGSPADKPHETRWAYHALTWNDGDLVMIDYQVGGNEYTTHT